MFTGASDIGQGSDTVIAQIVAEELGLNVDDINVINSDTDVCPWDVGVHASRTTFVAGNAALGPPGRSRTGSSSWPPRNSTRRIEKALVLSRPKDLVSSASPEPNLALWKRSCARPTYSHRGQMIMAEYFYDPANENLDREFKGNLSMTYTFGAHGVEVEVDKETGKVKILNYVAAHDVGRAINPMLLEGQVYGGVTMGVGYALSEQLILHKGEVMNPNFRDYKTADGQGPSSPSRPSWSKPTTRTALSGPRASASRAACRRPRPSPTPSTTPSGCGSKTCPSPRKRSWRP